MNISRHTHEAGIKHEYDYQLENRLTKLVFSSTKAHPSLVILFLKTAFTACNDESHDIYIATSLLFTMQAGTCIGVTGFST